MNLSLAEVEAECEVEALADGEISSRLELVLQRHQLLISKRRPSSTRLCHLSRESQIGRLDSGITGRHVMEASGSSKRPLRVPELNASE